MLQLCLGSGTGERTVLVHSSTNAICMPPVMCWAKIGNPGQLIGCPGLQGHGVTDCQANLTYFELHPLLFVKSKTRTQELKISFDIFK